MKFIDRVDAGNALARALEHYKDEAQAIVIALPRGGVVVGAVVARKLNLPLDIVSPRKIGAPGNSELAIGAITETGEMILSQELIDALQVPPTFVEEAIQKEKIEALSRLKRYRKNRPPRILKGKKVILVDDGIATGSTMFAAIQTVIAEGAKTITVAIPVAPPQTVEKLQARCDEVIALFTPTPFFSVSQFYIHFDQTSESEVIELITNNY